MYNFFLMSQPHAPFLYVVPIVGPFFEVLIGARPEPLWRLLGNVGMMYALLVEPHLTVTFVINMNAMWEKIISTLSSDL